MPHYLLLRLQRANKLITLYPGRLPWAIILLGLRPATARNISCYTITMAYIIIYCGELAHSKDGLKAQKAYSPEQRSGYKLTNYLAL